MSEVSISHKYEDLFKLLDDKELAEVDTVVLTGGRASGKSYSVSILSTLALVSYGWRTLYSRFTNTSIGDSIKEEVDNKIELFGYENLVEDSQYSIKAKTGSAKIAFKGIKTGSKGQTANLKSLSGFNCFIVDEAEEIPSFETFKKVYFSIRSVDRRNISILILNPVTKRHWIFKVFFKARQVPEGFCGVKGNVLYIHTSYLDVDPRYIPENIRKEYERMKIEDPAEYKSIVLGGWKNEAEGVIFKDSDLKRFKLEDIKDAENVVGNIAFIDVADTGSDFHAVPVGRIIGNDIFIIDVLFTPLGTDVNVDLSAEILNRHAPEFVRIESNFGGGMYRQLLSPKVNDVTTLLPIRATANKHSRIIQLSGFIKKHVHFRDDYEIGSDYDKFIDNMLEYTADGKAEHDDAPDSIEGLASMARSFHSSLWS